MILAPFSPIIMLGAFVFPEVIVGMIEASQTRKLFTPYTRSLSSTTLPICAVELKKNSIC